MRTWTAIKSLLARRYASAVDHGDWIGLTWKVGDAATLQRMKVQHTDELHEPCLLVLAELFDENRLGASAALSLGERLPVGALVVRGDEYLIRAVLPLADLMPSDLCRTVELLARAAARLRDQLAPRPIDVTLFAGYACSP